MAKCNECKGSGSIPLMWSRPSCEACGGSGEIVTEMVVPGHLDFNGTAEVVGKFDKALSKEEIKSLYEAVEKTNEEVYKNTVPESRYKDTRVDKSLYGTVNIFTLDEIMKRELPEEEEKRRAEEFDRILAKEKEAGYVIAPYVPIIKKDPLYDEDVEYFRKSFFRALKIPESYLYGEKITDGVAEKFVVSKSTGKPIHSKNAEIELTKILSKQVALDIDREIINDLLSPSVCTIPFFDSDFNVESKDPIPEIDIKINHWQDDAKFIGEMLSLGLISKDSVYSLTQEVFRSGDLHSCSLSSKNQKMINEYSKWVSEEQGSSNGEVTLQSAYEEGELIYLDPPKAGGFTFTSHEAGSLVIREPIESSILELRTESGETIKIKKRWEC